MIRLLLVAFIALWIGMSFRKLYQKKGKKVILPTLFFLVLALLIALTVMGKMHWLSVVVFSLLAVLRFLLKIVTMYAPFLMRISPLLWQSIFTRGKKAGASTAERGAMSQEHARAVLGVKANASKEDITKAHRQLIQRLHPDRGGTTRLTRIVNQARDTLLDS